MARPIRDEHVGELEQALERQIGARPTATLMAMFPTDYVRTSDLAEVRGELVTMRAENVEFRSFVREDLANARADLADMRSATLAAINDLWLRLLVMMFAVVVSVAGIVVAAVKL